MKAKSATKAKPTAKEKPAVKHVGFVLECQRGGPEVQVLTHLVPRIRRDVEPLFECLGRKRYLLPQGAKAASQLLADGCAHVFIVWDHAPPLDKAKPSCVDECAAVHTVVSQEGLDRKRVTLVCISYEMEAWLLADERALTELLVSKNHPKRIAPIRYPDRDDNPKGTLRDLVKQHLGKERDYRDVSNAVQIISKVEDLTRVERVQSFKRFKDRLLALR